MPLRGSDRAMDDTEEGVRKNGFGLPLHPLQVVSWVVSALDVSVYSFVGLPLLQPDAVTIAVALCYAASVGVMVCGAAKATGCNPVDPRVPRARESPDLETEDSEDLPYCPICEVSVELRSKHCRTCNKCIDTFDHHCMWLNNCIGSANYRAFFVTVCSVAVMTGILLSTCAYVLVTYFADEERFVQRAQSISLFRSSPRELLLGLTIALVVVNTPLFLLDLQLVLLHLFLMSQHLTTFEYIISKQEKLEAREEGKDFAEGKLGSASSRARMRLAGRMVRTLPRCMDWIVFCRCGKRRRRQMASNKIGTEDTTAPPPEAEETEKQPRQPEALLRERVDSGGFADTSTVPEPEEGGCTAAYKEVDEAMHKDLDVCTTDSPPSCEVALGTPTQGKPTGVLPQQRQAAPAKGEGSGCSAYSGIAVMWRFILGLGRTTLAT
mmetsp:Transcript_54049/g.167551  ORF Transcript_54049/g.167551 Transcript_54049/m.167551 type:complete len:437 (-) Transcript_54049:63-1373(-)